MAQCCAKLIQARNGAYGQQRNYTCEFQICFFVNGINCIGTFIVVSYTIFHQKTKIQFLDIDNFVWGEVPFYIQLSAF